MIDSASQLKLMHHFFTPIQRPKQLHMYIYIYKDLLLFDSLFPYICMHFFYSFPCTFTKLFFSNGILDGGIYWHFGDSISFSKLE